MKFYKLYCFLLCLVRALSHLGDEYSKPVIKFLDVCAHAILKMVGYIMWFVHLVFWELFSSCGNQWF